MVKVGVRFKTCFCFRELFDMGAYPTRQIMITIARMKSNPISLE